MEYTVYKRTHDFQMARGNVPVSFLEPVHTAKSGQLALEYIEALYGKSPVPNDIFFIHETKASSDE